MAPQVCCAPVAVANGHVLDVRRRQSQVDGVEKRLAFVYVERAPAGRLYCAPAERGERNVNIKKLKAERKKVREVVSRQNFVPARRDAISLLFFFSTRVSAPEHCTQEI